MSIPAIDLTYFKAAKVHFFLVPEDEASFPWQLQQEEDFKKTVGSRSDKGGNYLTFFVVSQSVLEFPVTKRSVDYISFRQCICSSITIDNHFRSSVFGMYLQL